MSAKEQVLQLVNKFKKENYLKDKTDAMGDGLSLAASLADEANERSKSAVGVTVSIQEKYNEQILTQDLNPNKDPEVVDMRNGYTTAGERMGAFESDTVMLFTENKSDLEQREINIMFPPPPFLAAVGDGLTDNRATIQGIMDYLSNKGGGTTFIPEGVFLLDSTLVDQGDFTIFIPRDNITVRGSGAASVLKVADGMNARYKYINAPNIFLKTTLLKNFSLINFTVDWNGENNLLSSDYTTRSNAVLYGSGGGNNVLVDRLIIKDLPGNQAVFFPDLDVESDEVGSTIVQNCEFINCGSGLIGNYNKDHSTVFLSGKGDRIINNKFNASGYVLGSPFEIHGPNAQSYNNQVENYSVGFWIAPHINDLKDTFIDKNIFRGVILAWGWGAGHGVGEHGGSIQITNNKFYFKNDPESHRPGDVFSIEGAKVETHRILVDNNEFVSEGVKNKVFMQVYKTKNFVFTRNKIQNFKKQVLLFANHDFGDGYTIDSFIVEDNQLINCGNLSDVIQVESPLKARILKINNNDILQNEVVSTNGIRLGIDADFGEVLDNNISSNYLNPFYLFAKSSKTKIRHIGDKDQSNGIYGDITSVVTNKTTGTVFTKKETNSTSWKRTMIGTLAPTSGNFAVGDEVINANPILGGYKGWICITAGTPGTWKGFGLVQS